MSASSTAVCITGGQLRPEPNGETAESVRTPIPQIHRALARLPRHEREVVELCVWSGLDQQAAAAALGWRSEP